MTTQTLAKGGDSVFFLLLMVTGGVVYGLHVYFRTLAPLAFISTVPWVLLLLRRDCACRILLFFGIVYIMAVVSLVWLAHFNLQSWLVAPLFYLPLFAPLYFVTRTIRRRWQSFPLVLLWPIVFTAVEWFRVRFSPGEIPFCQLGYALVDYPKLIQIVDVFGASVLTFMVSMISGFVSDLVLNYWETRDVGIHSIRFGLGSIILVFVPVLLYGFLRDSEKTFNREIRVMAIQPLLASWTASDANSRNLAILERLSREETGRHVDLIAWPENSVSTAYDDRSKKLSDVFQRIQKMASDIKSPILFDGPSLDSSGRRFHTSTLVTPNGDYQVYVKVLLVPWSEYLPFQSFLSRVSVKAENAYLAFVAHFSRLPSDMKAGNLAAVLPMKIRIGGKLVFFGTPVCAEIGSPQLLHEWYRYRHDDGKIGVDFVVNPTNEILLGGGIRRQTVTAARLRAIEGRVSVLRVANGGMSTLIDPNGRERNDLVESVNGKPEIVVATLLSDSRQPTIYSQIGDIFPIACLCVSLAVTILAMRNRLLTQISVR
jgi:apolipoprotein N-acyltransferase